MDNLDLNILAHVSSYMSYAEYKRMGMVMRTDGRYVVDGRRMVEIELRAHEAMRQLNSEFKRCVEVVPHSYAKVINVYDLYSARGSQPLRTFRYVDEQRYAAFKKGY